MSSIKTTEYKERVVELHGWPVRLTSYRLGEKYVAQAESVSPGSVLARFEAATLDEAEAEAISKARYLLSQTQRRKV